MARKRRRRPTAGPPPVRNPRHEAKLAPGGSPAPAKLPAGAPVKPTFRSVVIRSLLASAVFLIFLSLGAGGSAGANLVLVAVMFLFLLGFGYVFDTWFYRFRLRRWQRRRGIG